MITIKRFADVMDSSPNAADVSPASNAADGTMPKPRSQEKR
jgi:hypothetical protein